MFQRRFLALATLLGVCACAAPPPPPGNALTWAKAGVTFDAFRQDVRDCNVAARAAGDATPERPQSALSENAAAQVLILTNRSLTHAADRERAMNRAYGTCFGSRGYALIYLGQEDVIWIQNAPTPDEQLRSLHARSSTPHLRRARIPPTQQSLPLLAQIRD